MTVPTLAIRSRRRAMALPAVLLLVFVGLSIALAIHQFSTETYRRTARGTYATLSEVLAESAVEEAWYAVQRDVNTPGTQMYPLFRSENAFENLPVELPVLKSKLGDPQFNGYIADRYGQSSVTALVSMQWTNPYGNKMPEIGASGEFDPQAPWERFGVLTIKGAAQAAARSEGLANFRRMVVKRPFRLLLTTPPVPFDRSGLVILYPEHITDVHVAGLLDEATKYATSGAGKQRIMPMLDKANGLVGDATAKAKEFNNAYKDASSPPFGDHLTPPPKWLQDIIDKMGGLCSASTKLDTQGQGRRPFLFSDEVMVARTTMAGANLGKLSEFNYGRNIREKLGPLNDVLGSLQKVADITTKIITTLKDVHRSVPYGAKLQAMVAPLWVFIPETVPSIIDVCEGLHHKIMDPCLEVALGVGQVIAIAQKIVIEVPMMGQQAFAGFTNQINGAASGALNGAIGNIDVANQALGGLPTNTPAMGFALNMPLPNYSTGDDVVQQSGMDGGDIIKSVGESLMQLLLTMVEQELLTFVTEQITALTAKIAVSVPVTAAACAGPQAIVACVPAKVAMGLAFKALTAAIDRAISQKLNRIGGFKGQAMGGIVGMLCNQMPVFRNNPILQKLHIEALLGNVLKSAWEKTDISQDVDQWMQSLAQTFTQELEGAVMSGTGLDKFGGVLKGYVLRHRFRNLVEFDGASGLGMNDGGGASRDASVADNAGADGLNAWRSAFDRVFRESLWKRKATWVVKNKGEWEALLSRYFDGVYLKGKDPSGDGTSAWRDDSYAKNKGYGLSGVVFYSGTEELTLDWSGGDRGFIGKCVLYAPNASIIVSSCKMRDVAKDSLTVICGKPVKLPPTDVEIAVCAIGNGEDCKVEMAESTKILGSLVLKRYRTQDETDRKAMLDGDLTYNERLNGAGGNAIGGMKESHLFVTISPYTISREMETQP